MNSTSICILLTLIYFLPFPRLRCREIMIVERVGMLGKETV
jgi:hypothetical protein